MPEFNAMFVCNNGWYTLYHSGEVWYNEYLTGSVKVKGAFAEEVKQLYIDHPEKFQTDNTRRHNNGQEGL